MADDPQLDPRIRHALASIEDEFKDIPSGDDMSSKLKEKFSSTFLNPPVDEISFLLTKSLSQEEIRDIIFKPSPNQIDYYPILLRKPDAQIADANIRKIQPLILAFVYQLHRSRNIFIHSHVLHINSIVFSIHQKIMVVHGAVHSCGWLGGSGGYSGREQFVPSRPGGDFYDIALCCLRYNPMVSSQVEVVLGAIDCDAFDWFSPATELRIERLHGRVLALYTNTAFLSILLKNRTESYPGGSMRCLQILAFWLSWVRAMYSGMFLILQLCFMFYSGWK